MKSKFIFAFMGACILSSVFSTALATQSMTCPPLSQITYELSAPHAISESSCRRDFLGTQHKGQNCYAETHMRTASNWFVAADTYASNASEAQAKISSVINKVQNQIPSTDSRAENNPYYPTPVCMYPNINGVTITYFTYK